MLAIAVFSIMSMIANAQLSLRFQCETPATDCRACFPGSSELPCLPQKFPFPTDAECKVECRNRTKPVQLFECPFAQGQCVPCESALDADPGSPSICTAPFIDFPDCQFTTICGSRNGTYCDIINGKCRTCTFDPACDIDGGVKQFETFTQCQKACEIDPAFRLFYCTLAFECEPCVNSSLGSTQSCPKRRPQFRTEEMCNAGCKKPVREKCLDEFGDPKPNEEFFNEPPLESDCDGQSTVTTVEPGCFCIETTVRHEGNCIDPSKCPEAQVEYTCSRRQNTCVQCGDVVQQSCPLDRNTFTNKAVCDNACAKVAVILSDGETEDGENEDAENEENNGS